MIKYQSNTIQVHIARESKNNAFEHLLLKRSSDVQPYPNIWQVVTGRIETDEKAAETAIREFKEETSLTPLKIWTIPYVTQFFNPYKDTVNFAPVFGVLVDYEEEVLISSEHQAYKWLSANESKELLVLPSHVEGLQIFQEYILNRQSLSDCFLLNLKKIGI